MIKVLTLFLVIFFGSMLIAKFVFVRFYKYLRQGKGSIIDDMQEVEDELRKNKKQ